VPAKDATSPARECESSRPIQMSAEAVIANKRICTGRSESATSRLRQPCSLCSARVGIARVRANGNAIASRVAKWLRLTRVPVAESR
jgi:hypothetical protein